MKHEFTILITRFKFRSCIRNIMDHQHSWDGRPPPQSEVKLWHHSVPSLRRSYHGWLPFKKCMYDGWGMLRTWTPEAEATTPEAPWKAPSLVCLLRDNVHAPIWETAVKVTNEASLQIFPHSADSSDFPPSDCTFSRRLKNELRDGKFATNENFTDVYV